MQPAVFLLLACITAAVVSKSIVPVKSDAKSKFVNNRHVAVKKDVPASHTPFVNKIVGGNVAKLGEIPWQASVKTLKQINGVWKFSHHCGATIISEYWLLSAAHCFINTPNWTFQVTVGEVNFTKVEQEEHVFEVEKIYNHELYGKENTYDYDAALIKIKPSFDGRGIKYTETVSNACIYRYASPPVNHPLRISGWGGLIRQPDKNNTQRLPDVLQKALIPLLNQRVCEQKYPTRITNRMFCAGYPDKAINVCQGDSGGPAVYRSRGGKNILYGITSWGEGCAIPGRPAVFARVAAFYDWIQNITQIHSDNLNQSIVDCMKEEEEGLKVEEDEEEEEDDDEWEEWDN